MNGFQIRRAEPAAAGVAPIIAFASSTSPTASEFTVTVTIEPEAVERVAG